jgi:pimeloyl-ACP methyl ester carboxylesterase
MNANITGPYVLVGHSIGGIYARQFVADYPDQVAGVVLLDEAHPQQFKQYPELFAEGDSYLRTLSGLQLLDRIGLGHMYFAMGGEVDFSELPEPQKSQVKAFWASPRYFEAQRIELEAGREIWADASNLGNLNSVPLMVISRGVGLDYDWAKYQDDLVTLSTNSQLITVEGANHSELVFDPTYARAVSQAILQVVAADQTGTQLKP